MIVIPLKTIKENLMVNKGNNMSDQEKQQNCECKSKIKIILMVLGLGIIIAAIVTLIYKFVMKPENKLIVSSDVIDNIGRLNSSSIDLAKAINNNSKNKDLNLESDIDVKKKKDSDNKNVEDSKKTNKVYELNKEKLINDITSQLKSFLTSELKSLLQNELKDIKPIAEKNLNEDNNLKESIKNLLRTGTNLENKTKDKLIENETKKNFLTENENLKEEKSAKMNINLKKGKKENSKSKLIENEDQNLNFKGKKGSKESPKNKLLSSFYNKDEPPCKECKSNINSAIDEEKTILNDGKSLMLSLSSNSSKKNGTKKS